MTTTEHEEQEDMDLRAHLGLRPIAHTVDDSARKGSHPDQRPCPMWCWVGRHSSYDHEVSHDTPLEVYHQYDVRLGVAASHYRGSRDGDVIAAATVECSLGQQGQAEPLIVVNLRHYPQGRQEFEERLRLSVDDARDLAKLLEHLIGLADQR